MKKIIAILMGLSLCLPLCFSGCNFTPNISSGGQNTRVLQVAVSRELSDMVDIISEGLVRPMREISGGAFEINLRITDNPLQSLDQGDHLVIMRNSEAVLANRDFAIYTSPFYFRDYNHFAITLGGEDFSTLTAQENLSLLGAKPIGVLYAGGYTLFSGREDPVGEVDSYVGQKVGLLADNILMEDVMESLGARVVSKTLEDLVIDFSGRNIPTLELPNLQANQLHIPEGLAEIYYTDTFHRLDLNWVMVSEGALAEFNQWELAVLTESVSSLVAYNDETVLAREEEQFALLQQRIDISIEPLSYSSFTKAAQNSLQEKYRYANLWNWEYYSAIKDIC